MAAYDGHQPQGEAVRLTTETLALFFLLVPGFVSSTVLNAIVVRRTKDRISPIIIEALVFSFVIYACLAPFFDGTPVSIEVTTDEHRTTYRPVSSPQFLLSAMGLAILLPLAVGASVTHDLHMKALRWVRLTHRTARDNTWLDISSTSDVTWRSR